MDLRDIYAVVHLADRGGFHKAAAKLGIDASTLSRRVRRFEDEFGFPVFERGRYGVVPTGGGQELLRLARRVIEDIAAIQVSAGKAGRAPLGKLRLATQLALIGPEHRRALRSYRKAYPDVSLILSDGSDKDIIDELHDHLLDAAFIFTAALKRDVASLEIWRERLVLAVSDRHQLAHRRAVTRYEIKQESLIVQGWADSDSYKIIGSALLGADLSFQTHKVGCIDLLGLVSLGEGVMICLESHRELNVPSIRLVDIDDPNAVLGVSLAWSPTLENPVAGSFVAFMRDWVSAHPSKSGVSS